MFAFQISIAGKYVMAPQNWHSYAEAAEYCPFVVHLQIISSSYLESKTDDNVMKSIIYSSINLGVFIFQKFLIHLRFFISV
jgi:hypothetical protein